MTKLEQSIASTALACMREGFGSDVVKPLASLNCETAFRGRLDTCEWSVPHIVALISVCDVLGRR